MAGGACQPLPTATPAGGAEAEGSLGRGSALVVGEPPPFWKHPEHRLLDARAGDGDSSAERASVPKHAAALDTRLRPRPETFQGAQGQPRRVVFLEASLQ